MRRESERGKGVRGESELACEKGRVRGEEREKERESGERVRGKEWEGVRETGREQVGERESEGEGE